MIARAVLAPAGQRQLAAAAVAAAGAGNHRVVAAVGQQLHRRSRPVGIGEHAQPRLGRARLAVHFGEAGGVQIFGRGLRYAFLQQQAGGLELRVRFETPLHRPIQQRVRQRQQAHALVMRHERLHQRGRLAQRQPGRGVVDRFVEAIAARGAGFGQPLQISGRGRRRHHQCQRGGVWRDHHVFAKAAFEPQPGHAESAVLIGEVRVQRVVAGFGDAPRHAELVAVFDLARHRGAAGLVEQGAFVAGHHQGRHQVFEHRAGPRQQHRLAAAGGQQATERKPVVLRQLALRDAHEAGQSRLRREQVVVAGIEAAIVHVVADRQQVARAVVQEAVIHQRQIAGLLRQLFDRRDALACPLAQALGTSGTGPAQRLDPGQLPQRGDAAEADRVVRRIEVEQGRVIAQVAALLEQRRQPELGIAARLWRQRKCERVRVIQLPLQYGQRGAGSGRRRGQCRLQFAPHRFQRVATIRPEHAAQHLHGIEQALQHAWLEHRFVDQRQQARAQGQQVPGEVAAVHRRDVQRRQRLQALRVVPVVEMTAVARQLLHGHQRVAGAVEQAVDAEETEVEPGQVRQQRHADVGRRGTVGDHRARALLQIVRRQPVVGGADVGLEERPGAPCQLAQKTRLCRRGREGVGLARLADPPRQRGRQQPQQQQWCGDQPGHRPLQRQRDAEQHRQQRADPHQSPQCGGRIAAAPLDLAGGLPLQQMPATDRHAPQRAADRVELVQHFVRQPRQPQRDTRQVQHAGAETGAQVLVDLHVARLLHQIQQGRQQRRHQHHREHCQCPREHRRDHQPAGHQQDHQRRRHQAAAQVVQDLPARQRRQRVAAPPPAVRGRRPRQQPRQQLPVAADPAMATLDVGAVARRIFLEQLHVAEQAGARVATFDQVVAEDAVFRKAVVQAQLERVDRVDALADERAFAEHVLIDVRNHLRVRVDAGVAAVQLGVAGARAAGQADAHARLQDAVAGHHASLPGVVHRAVERMVDGADERLRRIARQAGVGVQRDHVLHRRQAGDVAHDEHEAAFRVAAQQCVEIGQLAALALVAHPAALGGIPAARAMEQEKAIRVDAGVVLVERLDAQLRQT